MKNKLKHRLKELIFDYHTPVDYNPFGGGFKPKGWYVFNKQKLINFTLLLSVVIIIFYIYCYV